MGSYFQGWSSFLGGIFPAPVISQQINKSSCKPKQFWEAWRLNLIDCIIHPLLIVINDLFLLEKAKKNYK